MRFPRIACSWLLLFLVVTFFASPASRAQIPQPPTVPQAPNQEPQQQDDSRERMEKDMAKRANQERQAQLKRDTQQLYKLATELKDYVDKSNENTLSIDVVKKADEIEKLAHSVKEKMKGN